jgi:tetratricopeptide (TPR) repeat protein
VGYGTLMKPRNTRKLIRISRFLIPGSILLAVLIFTFLFAGKPAVDVRSSLGKSLRTEVIKTWNSGESQKTFEMTRDALHINPFEPFFLSMNGIASYYLSMSKQENEDKQALLDQCVFNLRKAVALDPKLPIKPQVEYVLGKAYYQKGQPWFDLSAQYLENAIKDGYQAKDIDQYLALIYVNMQNHDKAVQYFEKALAINESDVLMLSAALSYKELGENEKALNYLKRAVEKASDEVVTQKARFLLAELAKDSGKDNEAISLYESILSTDPRSAEAWFKLGLMYELQKDPIKARAAWRKATAIDPNYMEARQRLAERY